MTRPLRNICVQWPRFGPYHRARLQATHDFLTARGARLIALETAAQEARYAWRADIGEAAYQHEQVFTKRAYEAIPPAEIHRGVMAMLDRLQPDAVAINTYSFPDSRACLTWCLRNRRVAVVMADTKPDFAPRTPWREALKGLIIRSFDAALLAGSLSRMYFQSLRFPDAAIRLGYDVVDNAYFAHATEQARRDSSPCRPLPGLSETTPFFLAVNRFLDIKNLDGLLTAYHQYRARTPDPWRLILVGDGPERAALEAQIQRLGLEGVVLAGFQQIDTLPCYYAHAGAFVHPTKLDQWGLVVNEAMASSLPVLVSKQAGCWVDLVQEGVNGYAFDPNDLPTLANRMAQVAAPTTDQAALGQASRAIIDAWTPARFAASLWDAIEVGYDRLNRRREPLANVVLWVLRHAARSTTTFHAVDA